MRHLASLSVDICMDGFNRPEDVVESCVVLEDVGQTAAAFTKVKINLLFCIAQNPSEGYRVCTQPSPLKGKTSRMDRRQIDVMWTE